MFVKRCLSCGERVPPDELVMRALDFVFHLQCFQCVACGELLKKGDQYVVKQGQLFCRPDYEKEVEMFQAHSQNDLCGDDGLSTDLSGNVGNGARIKQDGRRGPKRPRTILTTQQRRAFKQSFENSPKPCRKVREGLAKETGLSVRIVQVWFQNQRAKMKKMQKKARLEVKSSMDKDGDSRDSKSDHFKDDDNSSQSGAGYIKEGSDDTAESCLQPERFSSHLPIKEEHGDFYKAIIAADQHTQHPPLFNPGDTKIDGGYMGYSGGFPGSLYLPPSCPASTNPIDRLYSMQNSYFCGDEGPLLEQ